jgi:type IV pilus assembly protein PilE
MSLAPKKSRGFTLIELMITVAIMAILAAIAFPAFESQTRKSNRAAAQAAMMDIANKQAFYLTSQREYASGPGAYAMLYGAGAVLPAEVTKFYTFAYAADNLATPPTFTITAAPVAGTKQVKDGTLILSNTGTKTRTPPSGTPEPW